MNLAEIIDYINKNVISSSQLEGMRGMGLSIEPLPESYKAKKQTTDSGIDYYICNRNAETRNRLVEKLKTNVEENGIDVKVEDLSKQSMVTENKVLLGEEQRPEKRCSACGSILPVWALFCHICGNKY